MNGTQAFKLLLNLEALGDFIPEQNEFAKKTRRMVAKRFRDLYIAVTYDENSPEWTTCGVSRELLDIKKYADQVRDYKTWCVLLTVP